MMHLHGAHARHTLPPGPPGTLCGDRAADRQPPSPSMTVHRTIVPPPFVHTYVIGDGPPTPPPMRPTPTGRDMSRPELALLSALAGVALAVLAVAAIVTWRDAGPIRPHVASAEAPR